LFALQREVSAASSAGEPAYERYRARLDETLSPGMWRLIYMNESGTMPVDYKQALRELLESDFARTVRPVLRDGAAYLERLNALLQETQSLVTELDPAAVAAGR
jgi:hypothetical protein